jgi:lysophospholipase L1-like esterase
MSGNSDVIEKMVGAIGVILIIFGIATNEIVLIKLFSPDGVASFSTRVLILFFNLLFLGGGIATVVFRRTEVIKNLTVLIAAVAIALLLMEGYLRFRDWRHERETRTLRTSDPLLHHGFRPNTSTLWGGGAMRKSFSTNSLGFRDSKIRDVAQKTASSRRILFLGDSFTEGTGVDYEESVAGVFGELFAKNGEDVEVLNGGVASYSPALEYRQLKLFFDKGFQTDDVVVMLDISDIADDGVHYFDEKGEYTYITDEGAVYVEGGKFSWYRRTPRMDLYPKVFGWISSLMRLLRYRITGDYWPSDSPPAKWTEGDRINQEWVQRGIAQVKEHILAIRDLAQSHSAELTLVIYPWPAQLKSEARPSMAQVIFGDFAKENNIRLIDAYPPFFALGESWREYFIPGDFHWNAKGDAFIAGILYDTMKSSKR